MESTAEKRIARLAQHLSLEAAPVRGNASNPEAASRESVTVTDNRNGKTMRIPIDEGTLHATAFKDLNLRTYDPGLMNTAVCRSSICYIDGDAGILRYRGYNIEELAEKSHFEEVAYLLINGELPDREQLAEWSSKIHSHTYLHEDLSALMKTFRYDAHPMSQIITGLSGLASFYPLANPALRGANLYMNNEQLRNKQIYRILGKLPTIAACAYRQRIGRPYNAPNAKLGYTENFLQMIDRLSEVQYKPDPRIARVLDILFILHAEHELNCSTAAVRHLSSSRVDPFTALAGAAGALYGPLHGGANESVLRMLEDIGSKDRVPQYLELCKTKKKLLFGFGHRVYKNYDPRAAIVRRLAYQVFDIVGREPLIEIAEALEKAALADPWFVERKLYPNVDFYTGVIYKALGFPTDFFIPLFAIPRAAGWLAHWVESLDDTENHIARPRQIYTGPDERPYVPIEHRKPANVRSTACYVSAMSRRRDAGTDLGVPVAKSE